MAKKVVDNSEELQHDIFAMLNETEHLSVFQDTNNGVVEDCLPSFLPVLDKKLAGGLPVKFISELYGAASTGKSTLAAQFIRVMQHMTHSYIIYIDTEGSANKGRFMELGADPKRIWTITPVKDKNNRVKPISIEDIGKKIINTLASINQVDPDAVCLFIWDSIAVTESDIENDNDLDKSTVGQQAKALNKVTKQIIPNLQRNNGCLLAFNQAREDVNSVLPAMYRKEKTTGGKAWEHVLSLRFLIKSGTKIKAKSSDNEGIGRVAKLQVIKNKISDSWSQTFELNLINATGFDLVYNTVTLGQEIGLINSGRFPHYETDNGETIKGTTLLDLVAKLKEEENFEIFKELWQKEIKHFFPNIYPALFNTHSVLLTSKEPLIDGLRAYYVQKQLELEPQHQSLNFKLFKEKYDKKEFCDEIMEELAPYMS